MNARQLPERDYVALKCGTRDAVKEAGDVTRAAKVTRVAASLLSRYGAAHDGSFMPIDVVADIEAEIGEPIITRILAELAGYSLVPKERGVNADSFIEDVSETATEAGGVLSALGAAMADGRIDKADAQNALPKVRELQETLAGVEERLEQVEGGADVIELRRTA